MKLSLFQRRIRHPFFPQLAAIPAEWASGDCTAVAGTFVDLARAATRGICVRRTVYVLMHAGEHLTDAQRNDLWIRFQVPIYALLLDRDGHVVAWECEAQNGLHVDGSAAVSTCACGRPGAMANAAD